jgi:hypothetical protein
LEIIKALWDIEVVSFIDRQATGTYCGLDIIGFDAASRREADYIFIAFNTGWMPAIAQAEENGWRYNEDVFVLN